MISEQRAAFRIPYRYRRGMWLLGWETPMPAKGTVSFSGRECAVVGRLSIGLTLFFGGWVSGWCVGGIDALVTNGSWGAFGTAMLVGLAGLAVAYLWFAEEVERYDEAKSGVLAALGVATA